MRCLTFELTGPRRQDAGPAGTRITWPALPARRPAVVGPVVERGVRLHYCFGASLPPLRFQDLTDSATIKNIGIAAIGEATYQTVVSEVSTHSP
jgi:hypothetical protein